jgi:nucleotide-binding universal stress UspA family protein
MYKRIVAAVNEHTNAEISAKYAIAISKECQSALSIVFVSREGLDREIFHRAESAAERLFVEAEAQGIDVEMIVETGDPETEIKNIVKDRKVDLLFVSTRHEDVKKRFYIRTLARGLMKSLPCSVAMVRIVRMARTAPTNILVPLRPEMSDLSERAHFVGCLAGAFNSSVTLFHLSAPITSFFRGEIQRTPDEITRHVSKDMGRFTQYLTHKNIDFRKRVGYGSVSKGITVEAAQWRNELIVIGESQRSILRSMVSGNPVEAVLRETPCNLIVLKSGLRRE